MSKTVRILLMSALMLLGAGLLLYHYGSELNLEAQQPDQMLWEQSVGDKWLYAGGLMMLISGSLVGAAIKLWWGSSRTAAGSFVDRLARKLKAPGVQSTAFRRNSLHSKIFRLNAEL